RDGLIEAHEERGHVGRPARIYRLSDRGEGLYPHNYDLLANLLLEEVRAMAGAEALQRLLRRVSSRPAERYADRSEGHTPAERAGYPSPDPAAAGSVPSRDRKGRH